MPLRYEVSDLADVPEAYRAHYVPTEGGGFRLELDGYETREQLRAGLDAEKSHTQRARAELARLEKQAAESALRQSAQEREDAQRQDERVAQLNVEYEQEHARKLREYAASQQALIDGMRSARDRAAIKWAADSLAERIARPGCVALLLPHIRERLTVQEDGGAYSVGVKDLPSLDDLAAELFANPAFERIIIGASPQERAIHAKRVAETLGEKPPTQPLMRAQFEKLTPEKRAAHARSGATILDD